MTLGERVKKIRESKGWTQDILAEESDISKSYISEIENDKTVPGSKTLLQLANALGATVDYLLQGGNQTNEPPRTEIIIPANLSTAAEELNLTYSETLELQAARNSVVARRSDKEQKEPSVEEWKKFYYAIKEAFG